MRAFDLMSWASIVILLVGSVLVFLWFLTDAGKVLRGLEGDSPWREDETGPDNEENPGGGNRPG